MDFASLCELGICKSCFQNFRLFEENFRHFSADSSRSRTQEGTQEAYHRKIPPPKPPEHPGGDSYLEEESSIPAEELINSTEFDMETKVLKELPFLRDVSKTLLARVASVYEMREELATHPVDWVHERIQWKAVYDPKIEHEAIELLTRQLSAKRFRIDWLHLQYLRYIEELESSLNTEEMQLSTTVSEAVKEAPNWKIHIETSLRMGSPERIQNKLKTYTKQGKTPSEVLSLLYWANNLGSRELAEWYRDALRSVCTHWEPIHDKAAEVLWTPDIISDTAKKSEEIRCKIRTLQAEEEERVYLSDLLRYAPKE